MMKAQNCVYIQQYLWVMTQTFDDLSGVEDIMDDILVWGSTRKEHDARLEEVLKRCKDKNIKLNESKS